MTLSSVSGRSVVSGKVKGDILFSSEAISFLGGVNPKTGIVIARNHSLEGKSIKDTILVFPQLCHGCYACAELCPSSALTMVPQSMGELKHFEDGLLSFVEGRLDIGQEQAVPLIAETIRYIDDHFPADIPIIYDSPPGTSCLVIEVTKDADYVILVTEPTPFGLHDLKLAVDTMLELKKEFGVVINRQGIGNDDVLEYCKEENISVLANIPNDRRIAELYSRGELIYKQIPVVRTQ